MPKVWNYSLSQNVVINEKAKGLPSNIGDKGQIYEYLLGGSFDYGVRLDTGSVVPVKEEEVNIIDKKDSILSIKVGDEVELKHYGKVTVQKVDYLHRQVEVEFEDESSTVVDFDCIILDNKKEFVANAIKQSVEYNSDNNKNLHKKILDEIHDTYLRKNADYGSSFEKQYDEYGLLSLIIRLDDKLNRLKQLNKHEARVKDESIRDTLIDLGGYSVMGVMELDKMNE